MQKSLAREVRAVEDENRKATTAEMFSVLTFIFGLTVSGYFLQHQICLALPVLYREEYSIAEFRISDVEADRHRKGRTRYYASGFIGDDVIERCALPYCGIEGWRDIEGVKSKVAKGPYTIDVLYAPAWRLNEGGLNGGNFSIIPRRYDSNYWASLAIELLLINGPLITGIFMIVRHQRIYGYTLAELLKAKVCPPSDSVDRLHAKPVAANKTSQTGDSFR